MFAVGMLAAIDLDCELLIDASEVQDIRPERMLPAEFVTTQLPVAQQSPQPPFGIGQRFAENARMRHEERLARKPLTLPASGWAPPSPTTAGEGIGCTLPSPMKWEREGPASAGG